MAFINLPPTLQGIISGIENRLAKLELGRRFTFPNVSSDPANPRNGDAWLNTSSNTPKYVDATGAVSTFGGGGSSVITGNVKRPLTGYYYTPYVYDGINITYATTILNTMLAIPFMLTETKTATKIGITVIVPATGGVARLGIYSNSATEDYPNALLLDAGTISHATTGFKQITISQTLTAGTLYWLAVLSTTGNLTSLGANPYSITPFMPVETSAAAFFTDWRQLSVSAFPATFTATKDASTYAPIIFLGF
jgi:hypothetical protein